jgi:hypothetical protein
VQVRQYRRHVTAGTGGGSAGGAHAHVELHRERLLPQTESCRRCSRDTRLCSTRARMSSRTNMALALELMERRRGAGGG